MRPATRQDVIHVAQTMWERGIVELQHWPGGVTPERWLAGWYSRINLGLAVAFGPDKPHAILGVDEDIANPGWYDTVFQASKSFEAPGVGLGVTKEIRRAIPELMREKRIERSNTYSLCVSPESERWFRLLGLTEDTNYKGPQCGPFFMRRFFRSL